MEKLEGEVDKFVTQKDFDSLNFPDFRKSLLSIELKLAEFEHSLETSVSDCFYETKKLTEQLEELKPQGRKLEDILEATKEVKLPFKFESTLNTFTVRLLDLNFVEVLGEALEGKQPKAERAKKNFPGEKFQSPEKMAVFDRVITDDDPQLPRKSSVQSMSDRFNSSAFMKSKKSTARMTVTTTTADSHQDPYEMRKSVAFPNPRKTTIESARRMEEAVLPNDVNLNTCDNIYDLSRRLSGYKSFKVTPVAIKPEYDDICNFPEELVNTPSTKQMPSSVSTSNLVLKKGGSSLTRKSVVGDSKKYPKYSSSIISLNDDVGVIYNQIVDEARFKIILASLKTVPKHVSRVDMVNNVFRINPVPMLKSAFDSRLHYVLRIEITRNQMMANLVYTKRDLEVLANYNIVLVN